jgi:hypothetical protein
MCEQPDQFVDVMATPSAPHSPDRLSLARPFTYHSTQSYHSVRGYLSQGIPRRFGDDRYDCRRRDTIAVLRDNRDHGGPS